MHDELPTDYRAEQSVIGGLFLNNSVLDDVMPILGSNGAMFTDERLGHLYETIVKLTAAGKPADVVTVMASLDETEGYVLAVSECTGVVPTSANAPFYAQQVKEAWTLRQIADRGARIYHEALGSNDSRTMLDRAERMVSELSYKHSSRQIVTLAEVVGSARQVLHSIAESDGRPTGIPCGLPDIDSLTLGWQPGDFIIVAARPSVGKTAFALNLAHYAAIEHESGVLFFSLEMSKEQLAKRLICLAGGISIKAIQQRFQIQAQLSKIDQTCSALSNARIYLDESPSLTLYELRSKIRRHVRKYGPALILIDYLQLLRLGGRQKAEQRYLEVGEISRGLKEIAGEAKVPVIALCQLSRGADSELDPFRKLEHLRESGSLEQDADVVLILSRLTEKAYEWFQQKYPTHVPIEHVVQATVAKQRNGPTGTTYLEFNKNTQRFASISQYAAPSAPPKEYQPSLAYIDDEDEVPF